MRLKCLAIALVLSSLASAHADARLPIPDAKAQQEADKLVQEVFGKETDAATTPDAKLALTKKLLEESAAAITTPAGRYALLKAALGVAPDAKVAMSVIDDMAKQFQIEAMQAKAYTLKKMSAITPSERKALAEAAVELAGSYTEQDNYEAALALIDIALDAATKIRDSQLIRDIRAKKGDVASLEKQYADVTLALATLETDPTDTKSNSVVGKYKCFVKGAWDDGFPMLALGDDEALKALATKELMGAKASDEQVTLADGWYDLAQQSNEGIKKRMLERAGYWYQVALKSEPELSRLVKAKVEKRLGEIQETIVPNRPVVSDKPQSVDLLALIDPAKHGELGRWSQTKSGIYVDNTTGASFLSFPQEASEEYDLNIDFTLVSVPAKKVSDTHFHLPNAAPFAIRTTAEGSTLFSFWPDDRKSVNLGKRPYGVTFNSSIETGRKYELAFKVRKGRIESRLDGKLLFVLEGNPGIVRRPEKNLRLGSWQNQIVFHSVRIQSTVSE